MSQHHNEDVRDDIIARLVEWYEPDEIVIWMRTPQDLLGNRSPNELIRAGKGERVLRLIDDINYGAYL